MEITNENKDEQQLIKEYIDQLTEDEKIVFNIAKKHLKSSFSIEKSIGYLSWIKKKDL